MATLRERFAPHAAAGPLHFTPKLEQIYWFRRAQFGILSTDKMPVFKVCCESGKR